MFGKSCLMVSKDSQFAILWRPMTLALLLFMVSCQLDYGDAPSESLDEITPDLIIRDFEYQNSEKDRIVFKILALEARVFRNRDETILREVEFMEYGEDGEILTRGTADSGVFFGKTESLDMKGNLEVHSFREDTRILADDLFWDGEKKTLSSNEDNIVQVIKSDESTLEGKGFTAEMRLGTYEFTNGVTGTITLEDDEESEEREEASIPSDDQENSQSIEAGAP